MPQAPFHFISSSADKHREIETLLAQPCQRVDLKLPEVQSLCLETVVRAKAQAAFAQLKAPLLVEDTSLGFVAWGGRLPGVYIKDFLSELGCEGLVGLLPLGATKAVARCGVGFHDGKQVHYFEGQVRGQLVAPRGTQGFGWDPVFCLEGKNRTLAELAPQEKNRFSMRAQALNRLQAAGVLPKD